VLVAQNKYRNVKDLKGQTIGSLNPGGLVDALLRKPISVGKYYLPMFSRKLSSL
jgi:hypothetical protein